jgi:hypothetical protein
MSVASASVYGTRALSEAVYGEDVRLGGPVG